jgi:hypothetical protein
MTWEAPPPANEKRPGASTPIDQLIPQAITRDCELFFDQAPPGWQIRPARQKFGQ